MSIIPNYFNRTPIDLAHRTAISHAAFPAHARANIKCSYTAQDMMIVERDIGRLAKYTFDMGGTGDLLSLALSVPPWEDLHELSLAELRLSNLVTTDAVADVLPRDNSSTPMAELKPKATDRFVGSIVEEESQPAKSTKTAEAHVPTGGVAPAAPTSAQK